MKEFAIVFYSSSIFCLFTIRNAINSIFIAHVGYKYKYRRFKSRHTFKEKALLTYIRPYLRRYIILYDYLMKVHYLYLAVILSSFILLPILAFLDISEIYLHRIFIIKLLVLDLPIGLLYIFGTKHNPNPNHGGVVWWFEIKKRNR